MHDQSGQRAVLKTDKLADSVLAERVGCTKITHSKVVPEDARHQVDSGVRTWKF